MLSLDSERWDSLKHAYGAAGNLPDQLRLLDQGTKDISEIGQYLYSMLVHQWDAHDAAYAALPHIVHSVSKHGFVDEFSVYATFMLIAGIEISRVAARAEVPDDLSASYFSALKSVPDLVSLASSGGNDWDDETTRVVLASLAASRHKAELGYFLIEASSERREIVYNAGTVGELIPINHIAKS